MFLWTWGHESNTFNNVTQCGLLYPHRCKLNICFNLNYCSNNSYKKVPTLAQGNSDGHFFFCSLPTIYRSIKTIADSLTDHDSNRQSLALRGWFFYPHFCEISTIPSWAFDDIIFPSIRGSPPCVMRPGVFKGPGEHFTVDEWASEEQHQSRGATGPAISPPEIFIPLSLWSRPLRREKMVNSAAIFGMKWQRHDGDIFERFSKETEEGTVTDCTQASRLLPVEPSCPYGYPVC